MKNKRLRQVEKRIEKIKQELQGIGEMRPGSLTRQYRIPEDKVGPYYQISYTYKMKSHTEYVRPTFVKQIKIQIVNYKRFKKLIEKWIKLGIEHSTKKMAIAKLKRPK
jgi:hypothetical protein